MEEVIYASAIKGYCQIEVCWQFLYDISSQLAECHKNKRCCNSLCLNKIEIQGYNFKLSEQCLSQTGSQKNDVWRLGALAFELMLGTPIFNGMGEEKQTSNTPLPSLQNKDMAALNQVLHLCLQKDEIKRPEASEIMKIAFEELQKCKNKTRKARIYTTKEKFVQEDEFDKKWSESIMNLKGGIICLLLMIFCSFQVFSQSILDADDETYTKKLVNAVLLLRSNDSSSKQEAESELSKLEKLFTLMDELKDNKNDCALINKNVKSFGLNRMVSNFKRSKNVVQNTNKGLLDGSDLRYKYSMYEKGIKKGSTAVYEKLSGRTGKQLFVIIPYLANQSYETELSLSDRKTYKPVHKDEKGITYYLIEQEDGPSKDEVLVLKIKNKDLQSNRSFVVINHNYRNKN